MTERLLKIKVEPIAGWANVENSPRVMIEWTDYAFGSCDFLLRRR